MFLCGGWLIWIIERRYQLADWLISCSVPRQLKHCTFTYVKSESRFSCNRKFNISDSFKTYFIHINFRGLLLNSTSTFPNHISEANILHVICSESYHLQTMLNVNLQGSGGRHTEKQRQTWNRNFHERYIYTAVLLTILFIPIKCNNKK